MENYRLSIVTWNINSIRSVYKSTSEVKVGLDGLDADVICLQETKVARHTLDEEIALVDGYNSYFGFPKGKSGYSGVATYCKDAVTPFQAEEGLSGFYTSPDALDKVGFYGTMGTEFDKSELRLLDSEGRCVVTAHKMMVAGEAEEKVLALMNVYCPRAAREDAERMKVKLRFYQLLEARAQALQAAGYYVVIVGDINACHKPIDHCEPDNAEYFNENPCQHWLDNLIYDPNKEQDQNEKIGTPLSVIDAFRYLHPSEQNAFTCWNTRLNARSTNYGTRIDYILVDTRLAAEITDCAILKDIEGSDHCPVKIVISVKVNSSSPPSACTKFFPEFVGKQKKLDEFFSKKSSGNFVQPSNVGTKHKRNDDIREENKSRNECKKQKAISSFFSKMTQNEKIVSSGVKERSVSSVSVIESFSSTSTVRETVDVDSVLIWKGILTGPKAPPMCKHGEPSALKCCKKKGNNYNRMFWSCPRGQGRQYDPNASCGFFQWQSSRR